MIKVALYGLVRVLFVWLDRPPLWLGVAVVVLGGVSALGGIGYALFQHELKRLLAMSSIENVGIILLGLGAALILREQGEPGWAGIAFAASLLHTLNHAVFKALLFSVPAHSTAPSTGSSSIAWADCCAACPGPASRS